MFFRGQLCPFRNREQNFKLESSYFATWVKGLYWKDSVVSSRHSSRQPFRGPSATPRNLRMCTRLVMLPLQASTCTKQAWGWTVWRTFIQIRENRYLFFVVVMSYECILNCVPFFIIYALTIPIPPSPSVGNLVLRSFQSSESGGIIPCFREPQWPEELLLQGSSLLAEKAWEGTDLAVRKFSDGKLAFDTMFISIENIWNHPQPSPSVYNSRSLLNFRSAFHRSDRGPVDCLHMGTNYVPFSRH